MIFSPWFIYFNNSNFITMKKKINKKLQLNKQTIAKLNNDEMNNINGGKTVPTFVGNCTAGCTKTDICCIVTLDRKCLPDPD